VKAIPLGGVAASGGRVKDATGSRVTSAPSTSWHPRRPEHPPDPARLLLVDEEEVAAAGVDEQRLGVDGVVGSAQRDPGRPARVPVDVRAAVGSGTR
jgi:hypothetical protein